MRLSLRRALIGSSIYALASALRDKYPPDVKVILCHGCFDPVHYGHLLHFAAAREYGEVLAVTVTADQFINKGQGRPIFSAQERLQMLASLRVVDAAAISDSETAVLALEVLRPTVYVKGIDYKNSGSLAFSEEVAVAERLGISVRFTETAKSSATEIARRAGWLKES